MARPTGFEPVTPGIGSRIFSFIYRLFKTFDRIFDTV